MMRKTIITLLLCTSVTTLFAQENSPYSRYGVGLLKDQQNVANRGMGGVSVADNPPLVINPLNPASYASLKLTTYQVGFAGVSATIRNSSESNRTGGAGLNYINVAFPVAKNAGISFGLLPYSSVNYNMQRKDSIAGISRVLYDYLGEGGLQKVYVGGAYKYQGLSLGINLGYIFGNYQNNLAESFTDTLNILNTNIVNKTAINGLTYQLGMLYELKLKEDQFLNFGLSYGRNGNLNATRNKLWYAAYGDVNTGVYSYLTDSLVDQKGKVNIPHEISTGIMYGNGDAWKVGIDYARSDWSQYTSYDQVDSFKSSYTIRIGGAFVPDVNELHNVWKTVTYRLGGYYRLEPIFLNNTQFTTTAITAGLSYPIRRTNLSVGQLNAALDIGKSGTLENGLVQKNFTRFALGITLNDKWFLKRKYD